MSEAWFIIIILQMRYLRLKKLTEIPKDYKTRNRYDYKLKSHIL